MSGNTRSCRTCAYERAAVARTSKFSQTAQDGGHLLGIKDTGKKDKWGKSLWEVQCTYNACSTVFEVSAHDFTTKRRKTCKPCGRAISKSVNTTHGQSGTPAYVRSATSKRRAAKTKATPPWFSLEELAIREFYRDCPDGYHVDHREPLQGQRYGICGLHTLSNLQYLLAGDNSRKLNKFTPYIQDKHGNVTLLSH